MRESREIFFKMGRYLSALTARMRFLWIALTLATIVTLLFVACGNTPSTPTTQLRPSPTAKTLPSPTPSITPIAVVHVKIIDLGETYAFDPETLNIKVGTQVVWTNDSHAVHTVTSDTQV